MRKIPPKSPTRVNPLYIFFVSLSVCLCLLPSDESNNCVHSFQLECDWRGEEEALEQFPFRLICENLLDYFLSCICNKRERPSSLFCNIYSLGPTHSMHACIQNIVTHIICTLGRHQLVNTFLHCNMPWIQKSLFLRAKKFCRFSRVHFFVCLNNFTRNLQEVYTWFHTGLDPKADNLLFTTQPFFYFFPKKPSRKKAIKCESLNHSTSAIRHHHRRWGMYMIIEWKRFFRITIRRSSLLSSSGEEQAPKRRLLDTLTSHKKAKVEHICCQSRKTNLNIIFGWCMQAREISWKNVCTLSLNNWVAGVCSFYTLFAVLASLSW